MAQEVAGSLIPDPIVTRQLVPDVTTPQGFQAGRLRKPTPDPRREQPPSSSVFADLFAPLGADLVRGVTRPSVALLGIGTASALSARPADRQLASVAWPTAADPAFHSGKYVGNSFMQMGGALAMYTVGRTTGSARTARLGAMIFRAQVVAEGYTRGIKLATSRTRPDGTGNSFPSGHSAASFATATVLASEFGPKVGIPAYAAAVWVAASRLEAHRHFLSDVVAGAAVGILAGRSVTIGTAKTRFALTPIVPTSGAGVGAGFTKVVSH
jgi:membrane-associated phospholipid phosphatase